MSLLVGSVARSNSAIAAMWTRHCEFGIISSCEELPMLHLFSYTFPPFALLLFTKNAKSWLHLVNACCSWAGGPERGRVRLRRRVTQRKNPLTKHRAATPAALTWVGIFFLVRDDDNTDIYLNKLLKENTSIVYPEQHEYSMNPMLFENLRKCSAT